MTRSKAYVVKLLSAGVVVFTSACSTGPKPKEISRIEPVKINTKFTQDIRAQVGIAATGCPRLQDSDSKKGWRDLVELANRCVTTQSWPDVERLGHWLAEGEIESPWGAYYLSLSAFARKDHHRALWLADLALKKAPGLSFATFQKGRILWALGDFGPAVNLVKDAVHADATLVDGHLFLAQVEFRDQDFKAAAIHFAKVLEFRPQEASALVGLVECHLQNSKPRDAADVMARAIKFYPKRADYYLRQGYIFDEVLKDEIQTEAVYKQLREAKRSGGLDGAVPEKVEARLKELEKKNAMARKVAGVEKKNQPAEPTTVVSPVTKGGTQ